MDNEPYTPVSIKRSTKNRVMKIKKKYGFKTYDELMKALTKHYEQTHSVDKEY